MRFVPIKSAAQLDVQALHRARDRLVASRTGLINQIRAFLLERGIALRQGRLVLAKALPEVLETSDQLSPMMRALLARLRAQWRTLDDEIAALDRQILDLARAHPTARPSRVCGIGPSAAEGLMTIPGSIGSGPRSMAFDRHRAGGRDQPVLGPAKPDPWAGQAFGRGRDLACWLGLVPRQHSTGGKPRLLGIGKRGNGYLRRLLVHAARALKRSAKSRADRLGVWLRGLEARAHPNVVTVALAAKLARWSWAVLARNQTWRPAAV